MSRIFCVEDGNRWKTKVRHYGYCLRFIFVIHVFCLLHFVFIGGTNQWPFVFVFCARKGLHDSMHSALCTARAHSVILSSLVVRRGSLQLQISQCRDFKSGFDESLRIDMFYVTNLFSQLVTYNRF